MPDTTQVGKVPPLLSCSCMRHQLFLPYPRDFGKACEAQEKCRDAALELVDGLDVFVIIHEKIPELQRAKLTRRVVADILLLVARVSDYVRENTSESVIGQFALIVSFAESHVFRRRHFLRNLSNADGFVQR